MPQSGSHQSRHALVTYDPLPSSTKAHRPPLSLRVLDLRQLQPAASVVQPAQHHPMRASDERPLSVPSHDSCPRTGSNDIQGVAVRLPVSTTANIHDDQALQPLELVPQSLQLQEPQTASTTYHTASPGQLLSGPAACLQANSSCEADSQSSSADFRVAQSTLGLARCHLQILSDSEEDEGASAAKLGHGSAVRRGHATLSRQRMPVCRLSFSPAGSPCASSTGALRRRCASPEASSEAEDGDDERARDTDCAFSLACSEELEERVSPAASLSQPLSPVGNLAGALHDMILQEGADSPAALSPASGSSSTSSPHLAWATGQRRMAHTIIHDGEDSSAGSPPVQAEEPKSTGCSGGAPDSSSDGFPLSFRRRVARPARQGLTLSPQSPQFGDTSSQCYVVDLALAAAANGSRCSPAAQQSLSPLDPYAFSSGRGRQHDRQAAGAEGKPLGSAARPGSEAVIQGGGGGSSSGDENGCAAWVGRAASPEAALLRLGPLAGQRWASPEAPGCLGALQQGGRVGCAVADAHLVTPQRPVTLGRPPRPKGPPGQQQQQPPPLWWAPCSVPALPRALPGPPRATGGGGGAAQPLAAAAFKRRRSAMARGLFEGFNATVFGGRLPADLEVSWNARLKTTAGITRFQRAPAAAPTGQPRYTARVELSSKVVDAPEKLRCTLLHELCHCAAWVLPPHEHKPPHGPAFKRWAAAAALAHPDVPVTTCHSYDVFAPFRWQCMNPGCAQVYQRHSNSIDVRRRACGRCQNGLAFLGRFQPDGTPAQRRPPPAFSAFVRDNFAGVRAGLEGTPHREVMQALAAMWRQRRAEEAAADSGTGLGDLTAAFQDVRVA